MKESGLIYFKTRLCQYRWHKIHISIEDYKDYNKYITWCNNNGSDRYFLEVSFIHGTIGPLWIESTDDFVLFNLTWN